jgi:hypothetical protein
VIEFPLDAGATQADDLEEVAPDDICIAATPGLLLHGG